MTNTNGSQDRFYKKAINGRDGNVFTRLEALEQDMRRLIGRNATTIISQLIQQNREIILSSVAGGTTDPTADDFTGVVISPSGQVIDGVLYNFALVENGVVLTGLGDDGAPVIVGGGDVFGPTSATIESLAYFSNVDGKHIDQSYIGLRDVMQRGALLWFDDTASGISTYKTAVRNFSLASLGTTVTAVTSGGGSQIIGEFISEQIGLPRLISGFYNLSCFLASSVNQSVDISFMVLRRDTGGTETTLLTSGSVSVALTSTPSQAVYDYPEPWSEFTCDPTDRLVIRLFMTPASNANITLYNGDPDYPGYVTIPYLPPSSSGGGGAGSLARSMSIDSIGI